MAKAPWNGGFEDKIPQENFPYHVARGLAERVIVQSLVIAQYARAHRSTKDMAERHIRRIISDAALGGRLFRIPARPHQGRPGELLWMEVPESVGKYGVLISMKTRTVVQYRTGCVRDYVQAKTTEKTQRVLGMLEGQNSSMHDTGALPVKR